MTRTLATRVGRTRRAPDLRRAGHDRHRGLARLRRHRRGGRGDDPARAARHGRGGRADDRLPGLAGGRLRDRHDGRDRRRRRQRRPAAGPGREPPARLRRAGASPCSRRSRRRAGPLGTNELARRHRHQREHRLARARDAARGRASSSASRARSAGSSGSGSSHLGNAALARLDLRDLARPLLEQLVRETGETATLSLPAHGRGRHRRLRRRARTASRAAPRSAARRLRTPRPSASSCSRTRRARSTSLGEPLERYTPRTLTTLAEIEHAVGEVRAAGVAEAARRARAGAQRDRRAGAGRPTARLVAVLGLQGPERFDAAARRAALPALRAAAATLSRRPRALGATAASGREARAPPAAPAFYDQG